jgi:hypothetical protein
LGELSFLFGAGSRKPVDQKYCRQGYHHNTKVQKEIWIYRQQRTAY